MCRYRYRPVTSPLPFLASVHQRYWSFINVTDRYLNVTHRSSTLPQRSSTLPNVTQRDLNVTHRYPPLPTVIHRYSTWPERDLNVTTMLLNVTLTLLFLKEITRVFIKIKIEKISKFMQIPKQLKLFQTLFSFVLIFCLPLFLWWYSPPLKVHIDDSSQKTVEWKSLSILFNAKRSLCLFSLAVNSFGLHLERL